MEWFRVLSAGLFLSLGVLSVSGSDEPARQPDTVPPHKITEGWISAFDGKTTAGWKIEGEAKVIDGKLVLGGSRPTKAVLDRQLGDEFEFLYECRDLGKKTHCLEIKGSRCSHSAGGGDANETNRPWRTQRIKSFYEGNSHVAHWYLWHGGRWVGPGGSQGQVPERRGTFQLSVEIAEGSQVEIRNFKFRPMKKEEKQQDKEAPKSK